MIGSELKLVGVVKRRMTLPMTLVVGCGNFQDVEALHALEGLLELLSEVFLSLKVSIVQC